MIVSIWEGRTHADSSPGNCRLSCGIEQVWVGNTSAAPACSRRRTSHDSVAVRGRRLLGGEEIGVLASSGYRVIEITLDRNACFQNVEIELTEEMAVVSEQGSALREPIVAPKCSEQVNTK